MSRKPEKSRREGHRRSPRICALDAWKMAQRSRRVDSTPPSTCTEEMERDLGSVQGPASRTRARKKIKLRPVEELASTSLSSRPQLGGRKFSYEDHQTDTDQQDVWQWDKNSPKCKKQATYTDQPSTTPFAMWLPEKRLLELILDILQRRDTHEIFAEPVDPEEVEDYYKIIEEPMDFGTMRAKLHEGMYSNLEQFEHDVFLISRNAMHFNSSGTIYFRQARAISELANKVFQVLKTHPVNFEMELLEIRRRSGRRPQNEAKNSLSSTCPKIGANMNSSRIMIEESSKLMPRSRSNSNIRRRFQVNQVCSDFFTGIDATEHEMLAGSSDGRRSRSIEEDRRDTYRPWGSFLSEDESIFATISSHSKQLEYVSQQDIGYRESLMLFVKDLEPTAQMVAKQKLLRGFQERKSLFSMKSTNTQWGPSILDTVNTVPISQNFLDNIPEHPTVTENTIDGVDWRDADKGEKAYMGSKMVSRFATVEMKSDSEIKKAHSTTGGKVHTSNDITNQVVFFGEKFHQNQTNDAPLCSYSLLDRGKGFNCSIAGCKGTGNNSTMILDQSKLYNQAQILESPFDTSHSNLSEVKLKNLGLSSFHYGKVSNKLSSAPGQNHGVSSSSEVTQALISDRSKPPTSQFIFDLPYLKARLGQINFSGRDRLLEQGSGTEVPFFNGMSNPRDSTCTHQVELNTLQPYRDDQPQSSSLDAHHRDLALQL